MIKNAIANLLLDTGCGYPQLPPAFRFRGNLSTIEIMLGPEIPTLGVPDVNVLYHSLLGLASPQEVCRSLVRDGEYSIK
jgi:hypothetical protein